MYIKWASASSAFSVKLSEQRGKSGTVETDGVGVVLLTDWNEVGGVRRFGGRSLSARN